MLKNDRLIRALLKKPVDQVPVWLMRQAGRYLPEYRKLRQQAPDFVRFCRNSELTVEATLQPIHRFDLDAAIIFSDILVIPEAMGMGLHFQADGPAFSRTLTGKRDLAQLKTLDVADDLSYVLEAIEKTCLELNDSIPLIGFAGSPWTVACYMVEGASSKTWSMVKQAIYHDPAFMHALLDLLADITINYLNAQIKAGARAVMLFDTWGGILAHDAYRIFSLHYMQKIADGMIREYEGNIIPLTFFTKNAAPWLNDLAASGCDAVGLDASIDLVAAQAMMGDRVAVQGNVDPWLLFSDELTIKEHVKDLLARVNPQGYVFNLGHGVHKDTPVASVQALVDAVRQYGGVANKQHEKTIYE